MKRLILFSIALTVLAATASIAAGQKKNPKLDPNLPKGSVKMVKPDLKISDVQVTTAPDTGFIKTISVTVTNGCQAKAADSYLLITLKTSAEEKAQTLLYVGNTIKALKGGESQTQTFDVGKLKNIPAASFILVEADSKNKIDEGDEKNNWLRRNPNSAPFPLSDVCEPK